MKKGLLFFLLLFLQLPLTAQRVSLNQGWEFFDENTSTWLPATVPGNIHQDLWLRGRIPHPFAGSNEDSIQWVGEKDWTYRLHFTLPDSLRDAKRLTLCFESLDAWCQIDLDCPRDTAVPFVKQHDWDDPPATEVTPPLPPLVSFNAFVPAVTDVTPYLHRTKENTIYIRFNSPLHSSQLLRREPLVAATAGNDAATDKYSPFVRTAPYHFGWDWAPRLVTQGIRGNVWLVAGEYPAPPPAAQKPRVELVRERDSIGVSYYFRVDGEPVFMKGANYIPQDEYFPAHRRERIREMLLNAKESGFNMIRVWGGGIYEDEYFYDLCDSLGLYVWQDFMFACSMYPSEDYFRRSVQEEAVAQVQRLRHHPCIVLWCGNNEVEVAWKNWGWQQQFGIHGEDSVQMWHNYQYLFDTLLPAVVQEHDPLTPYISTSPLSNWGAPERFNSGDNHYWGVWHGEEPFENFRSNVPRFMSEYGFQSFPDLALMQAWGAPADTTIFRWHQKSYKGSRMIAQYAEEWFGKSRSVQEQLRKGQYAQAEAYRIAIGSHRAAQPRCMGTLYWQLNDCWPGPSWSSMDYMLNWKPLQYLVKRMYSQHLLIPVVEDGQIRIWFSNHEQAAGKGLLRVELKNFRGKVINAWQDEVTWKGNTTEVLTAIPYEKWIHTQHPRGVYLTVQLRGDGVETKEYLCFEKPADLHLPSHPDVQITSFVQTGDGGTLTLKAGKFAKGVWLEIPERDAQGKLLYRFSDNYFDMEAGEEKTITVLPTTAARLKVIPDPLVDWVRN